MTAPTPNRSFTFVCDLPAGGTWVLTAAAGVVLAVDQSGQHHPRMVDGEGAHVLQPALPTPPG